jgi:putative endonuclease
LSKKKQALGKWGEKEAAAYLQNKGYVILEQNYRNEFGEIDLVAEQNGDLIFVEVKTRSGDQFGFPEEAVNAKKQKHVLETAQIYLQELRKEEIDWRIDVISILRHQNKTAEIAHFENAFN